MSCRTRSTCFLSSSSDALWFSDALQFAADDFQLFFEHQLPVTSHLEFGDLIPGRRALDTREAVVHVYLHLIGIRQRRRQVGNAMGLAAMQFALPFDLVFGRGIQPFIRQGVDLGFEPKVRISLRVLPDPLALPRGALSAGFESFLH